LTGDHQLFAREDGIEETWRIVQPVLDKPGRIHHYHPGSWGPDAAQSLLHGHRSWQQPWLPQ
jgi:glucose-6-phosphate 1-dehydrogenase